MSMSPGMRNLVLELAGWSVVAGVGAFALMNYDSLEHGVSTVFDVAATAGADASPPATEAPAARSGSVIEIPVSGNGHFHTTADVNGRGIEFLIDTGATMVALSYEDAERAGIFLKPSDFTRTAQTANGSTRIAPVELHSVSIGDITVRRVPAAVMEPGRLDSSLLGMSFLNRLSRFDMRDGVLTLQD
jgi:aspartyl protease family protein